MLKDKLKALRLKADLTQSELAKEVELPQSCISLWEKGSREPNLSGIKKLAEFFNVTTDYLLDLTNEQKEDIIKISTKMLTKDEEYLLDLYRSMDTEHKEMTVTTAELYKRNSTVENAIKKYPT